MAKEAEGSVGMDVSQLARAASHAQPYPRVDSQGQILSADALKLRGMHAAQYHKTSIEAMLHSTHAGATPYRTVLGDVRLHLCTQLCPVMSVRCLFVHPYICPSVYACILPPIRPPILPSICVLCYYVASAPCSAVSLCSASFLKSAHLAPSEPGMHDSQLTQAIDKPTQHYIDKSKQQGSIPLHEHPQLML